MHYQHLHRYSKGLHAIQAGHSKGGKNLSGACIVVTGCYAQTEPMELGKIAGVDYVIGHSDKHHIPAMVSKIVKQENLHPVMIGHDIAVEKSLPIFRVLSQGDEQGPF